MKCDLPDPKLPCRYVAWLRPSRSALPTSESARSNASASAGVTTNDSAVRAGSATASVSFSTKSPLRTVSGRSRRSRTSGVLTASLVPQSRWSHSVVAPPPRGYHGRTSAVTCPRRAGDPRSTCMSVRDATTRVALVAAWVVLPVASALVAAGCWSPADYRRTLRSDQIQHYEVAQATSGHIGCPPEAIEIVRFVQTWNRNSWTARCEGERYYCTANANTIACAQESRPSRPARAEPQRQAAR